MDLQDRVAIVSGGARGIGLAIVEEFIAQGASVVIVDSGVSISGEPEQPRLAEEVSSRLERTAAVCGDIADAAPSAVEVAQKRFGSVDIVVNNAAMSPGTLLHESSAELFQKTYATNTLGPMLLASRCAERMRDSGGGVIINVVTTGAFRPGAGLGLYCSSKAALHALTLVMAKEWAGWGVRVNEIAPGPFLTDMMAPGAANPEFTARMYDSMLIKRIADPSEIVGAALYLASDASGFATGSTVTVDGGISA